MNPYASFLGKRDAREVVGETAARLADVVKRTNPEAIDRNPAPEKWSIRQILCHLADCEMVFGVRMRQALAEPYHVIQPFDQSAWARRYSSELTAGAALRAVSIRAELESGTAQDRQCRRFFKTRDASRAGPDDISNPARNHGRARSESSGAARKNLSQVIRRQRRCGRI